MKKITLFLITCFLSINVLAQPSQADLDFTVKYLHSTHQDIVNLIQEIPEDQWNYKPENGGWSAANCLEHILVTEAAFFGMAQNTYSEQEPDPKLDLSGRDGNLIGMITNRGNRVQTSEQFEPSGKWTTKKKMLGELEASRSKIIEFLKNTDLDLRSYKISFPAFDIDGNQIFLFMGAHSQRHTFQMHEVLVEFKER